MNVTLRLPRMTREQFLHWAARQEAPFEFDGFEPVPMTGGNVNHARLCRNLTIALGARLVGTGFELLPEAGIATVGDAVRYPDVLITNASVKGTERLTPAPIIVFEVLSPTSGRTDRHVKLREYAEVPSILRYVIVDNLGSYLSVFARPAADVPWAATSVAAGETLDLPEVGIKLPVDEVFQGVEFAAE